MTFIQDINSPRLIHGDEALAFYASRISTPPRPFHVTNAPCYPMPLLLLNRDEMGVESYNAAVEHTIKHRVPALDKLLQVFIRENDVTRADKLFEHMFFKAPSFSGFAEYMNKEYTGEYHLRIDGEKVELKNAEKRVELVRKLWLEALSACLIECGARDAADFFGSDGIKKLQKESPVLNVARDDLNARLSELSSEQKILIDGRGLEFIFSNDLGRLHSDMAKADFKAAYTSKATRIYFTPKGLNSQYTARQELDHFCMDLVGADKYPLIAELVKKLRDGRDPKVLKVLIGERHSSGAGAAYYKEISKFSDEVLFVEVLFDIKEIARRFATDKKLSIDSPEVDQYMTANFRDYWEVRKHADMEVKNHAYVRLQKANPDKDMTGEARSRFGFDTTPTNTGKRVR